MKSLVPVVCFALAACCAPAMAASLTTAPFGTTRDGKAVTITTMAARDGLTVRFIGYGGRITQILAPDRQGHLADIVLGYPTLAQYEAALPTGIPSGPLAPVAGTPFDFRTPHMIGSRIRDDDQQLLWAHGYDNNWMLNKSGDRLRPRERSDPGVPDHPARDPGLYGQCARGPVRRLWRPLPPDRRRDAGDATFPEQPERSGFSRDRTEARAGVPQHDDLPLRRAPLGSREATVPAAPI